MDYRNSRIYRDLLALARIPAVSPSNEENRVADYIYRQISSMPYFIKNPGDVILSPCQDDSFERNFIFAIVKSAREIAKTVLLTGHLDVVSADICAPLQDYAFDPEEYTRLLGETRISGEAAEDMKTGEWLFGRGVADMKSGLAAALDQLRKAGKDPSALDANLAVLFVPDEENNSAGMLSAVPYLKSLCQGGLEFAACIDMEPPFQVDGKVVPTAYLGTVGKINAFFYFEGIKAHVGEYFSGLSAGLISSCLNLELDGNPDFVDSAAGRYSLPFGCLRMNDLRDEYSASIVNSGYHIYSHLTLSRSPSEVLSCLQRAAKRSLSEAVRLYSERARDYAKLSGTRINPITIEPEVISYGQLMDIALSENVDASEIFERTLQKAGAGSDEREKSVRFVRELTRICGLEPPFSIYGFLPPWYPHRANDGQTEGDRAAAAAVADLVIHSKELLNEEIVVKPFFEGICDLSYCGYRGDTEDIKIVGNNMPGWNRIYNFPGEELPEIDIPVINFGPLGKDLHKKTERVHIPFLVDTYPRLLTHLIHSLSKRG